MFLDVKDEAMCKISGPSVHWKRIFSFESPDRPPRSLGGHSQYLNGFFQTLDFRNDTYINIKEALCKISGSLGAREVSNSYIGIVREGVII